MSRKDRAAAGLALATMLAVAAQADIRVPRSLVSVTMCGPANQKKKAKRKAQRKSRRRNRK